MTPRKTTLPVISLAVLLAVTACSAGGSSTGESTASPSPSTATSSGTASPTSEAVPASTKVLRVTIKGRTITPAPANVELAAGKTLRLVVTSDHDDQLHAHGFDKEVTLKAGQPTALDLTATDPGVYEVETHHPELKLFSVLVR